MIYLGITQELKIQKETPFGLYLNGASELVPAFDKYVTAPEALDTDSVLLPKSQIPDGASMGDILQVFIYKDSDDRPIATTLIPTLELGGLAKLTVKAVTPIGAFLDWGLAKDLLLPYREQTVPVKEGEQVLVSLYTDKSSRLCATMRVYPYLSTESPYQKGDWVDGTVYEILHNFGAFVVVDERFSALIPTKELNQPLTVGTPVHARVSIRREDGKLELSLNDKIPVQMDNDGAFILQQLDAAGGFLPYHDKSDPEQIKSQFRMSKNAFKRAIGHLMKEGYLIITDDGIQKK